MVAKWTEQHDDRLIELWREKPAFDNNSLKSLLAIKETAAIVANRQRRVTSAISFRRFAFFTFNDNANKSAKWHCGRHTTIKKT